MKSSAVKPGYITIAIWVMRSLLFQANVLRYWSGEIPIRRTKLRRMVSAVPNPHRDGDRGDGVVGLLELAARRFGADAFDVGAGRLADLVGEHPGEVARAHRGETGQLGDAVRATGFGFDGLLHRRGSAPVSRGPPRPARRTASARRGGAGTAPASGRRSARPRCRSRPRPAPAPGRCPRVTPAAVHTVGELRTKIGSGSTMTAGNSRASLVGEGPMRGRPAAVEQARLRGQERSGAHADDAAGVRRAATIQSIESRVAPSRGDPDRPAAPGCRSARAGRAAAGRRKSGRRRWPTGCPSSDASYRRSPRRGLARPAPASPR